MCDSVSGPSLHKRRAAIFVAEPPESANKCAKINNEEACIICGKATTTKRNPLQQPSQKTWNLLAHKCEEWRELGTDFSSLYKCIQVDKTPRKVHKICRLNVTGIKLKRAKKLQNKYRDNDPKDIESTEETLNVRRSSRISSKVSKFSCVICEKLLTGKTLRNILGERKNNKCHRIETETAWKTFVEAIPYVKDELRKSRMEALATFCNLNGGILKAAALGIFYHNGCWKSHCKPVYDAHTNTKRTVQRRQREQWVEEKKQEAFNKLSLRIRENLEIHKEVYTLRDLLQEYEQIQRDMQLTDEEIRNTCDDRQALRSLRNKLQKHFGEDIGFHCRYCKNESPLVYFPKHGGAYVESALNNWGIQTTHMIHNLAQRLYEAFHHEPGISWPCDIDEIVSEEYLEKLEVFTIRIIYNDPKSVHLNESRAWKWRQMHTSDSSRIPPDYDSFKHHCLRAHLQAYEWRNAMCMKKLIPSNFGWKSKDGSLIPIMHTTPPLPDKQSFSNADIYQEDGSEEYSTDSSDTWSEEVDELP